MRRILVLAALLVALPAGAVDIEYVAVRDADNQPDTATNCLNDAPDCGSVPYDYAISKYEITNAQYAAFLNAVAASDDPFGLYNPAMRILLIFDLSTGMFVYYVESGFENNPIVFVSWYDALRFTNWLHNGQPTGAQGSGTTEDGAYELTGPTSISGGRQVGALVFLPTENEWYKAAYYDAATTSFFDYPTGTNTAPSSDVPAGGSNSANCYDGTYALTGSGSYVATTNYLTDVGAYTGSDSPYGTFDQGGNVFEWNETASGLNRGFRGGSWYSYASVLAASAPLNVEGRPPFEDTGLGFRVARPVPEPAQVLLVLTGGLLLAVVRKRHAKAL